MVVMSRYHASSSSIELIDALNIETHPKAIKSNSFCFKDEVWGSVIHSFEILFVSLIKLCVPVEVNLI
jgi:hypothetical protein